MALTDTKKPAPPQHIAIIMDGNGRWAKKRGLPRTAGHGAGAESFRRIANYCRTLGVKYLTVYAFSTENWKRSEEEISGIMRLLRRYLEEALQDMEKNKVCFRFFGDLSRLSPELQKLCRDAENRSGCGEASIPEIFAQVKKGFNRDVLVTLEPHLETFSGLNQLVGKSFENPYKFESPEAAFDEAVKRIKEILK